LEANKITLQSILQQGYHVYERHHPLPGYVRRAVQAILACRTARLGGHVQACPEGHLERVWYNSCRHRMCPQCAWLQVERWLIKQKARLLAWDHYHVIFTMPSELHGLWLANVAVLTNLLFASVRDTLLELLGDPKYLGATPGIIATLHTWSQTLILHPHIHGLVTGGGLSSTGQWVAVRNGFLLPSRVVMALFRGKLLAAIDTAVREGQLVLPGGLTLRHWETLRNKLGRQKWNVHIRERYPHGEGVLVYLARYIRGGPMANTRLVSCEQGAVTFRYRLQGEGSADGRRGLMTVPLAEFVRRYLLHVPAPGTRVVRSYGLYAPTRREALACCREQVGQGPVEVPAVLDWQTAWSQHGPEHPERCPMCGRRLVRRGLISPSRRPPPEARPAEAEAVA
jgi:Putative transposase/Transposase zinc-binding domain